MSARPGRLLRDKRRDDAAARAGCAICPHTVGEHHELPREIHSFEHGQIVIRPNPAFRPWQFHCDHSECGCVVYGGAMRCRLHGDVDDDHFPCQAPGETAGQFRARAFGETRDV